VTDTAITIDNVGKRFRIYHERNQSVKAAVMRKGRAEYEDFWALRNVSLEIPTGSTYGLIGSNGSGKSTLLKCIAKILRPNEGSISSVGKMAALLELGSGFHPELSGRDNVYLNGSILGLSRKELDSRFDEIVGFAGLERFIDTPVKNYSSGMYVRLGFSVAINVDPEVLLVDEVLAVGDASFQRRCLEKFADFRREGRTVVIVSHDSGAMRGMCDQVAWLDHGTLLSAGPPEEVVDNYVDTEMETRHDLVVDASGAQRWGSGEARIVRAELLDRDAQAASHVRSQEPVTLRVHWEASAPITRPVFGLAIEALDGTHLWGHHSKGTGAVPEVLQGQGYVDCRVPHLALQPGTYQVNASIVDESLLHEYDLRKSCLRFDVERGDDRDTVGYVALGASWARG
jgi:ABC-2 type transport system ATP-binding protein